MGAGKSTVAKLLAEEFTDLDKLIEEEIEMPIATFLNYLEKLIFVKLKMRFLSLLFKRYYYRNWWRNHRKSKEFKCS